MKQDYKTTEICPMCKSKMRHHPSYKDEVGGAIIETEYGLVCDKHGTIDYFAYGHWESERLEPCPVCGKTPRIKRDYSYEFSGFGAWCTIRCKSFLRKPHLKIEEGKATWERALKYGIEHWNREVQDG